MLTCPNCGSSVLPSQCVNVPAVVMDGDATGEMYRVLMKKVEKHLAGLEKGVEMQSRAGLLHQYGLCRAAVKAMNSLDPRLTPQAVATLMARDAAVYRTIAVFSLVGASLAVALMDEVGKDGDVRAPETIVDGAIVAEDEEREPGQEPDDDAV
jgi:hypothetical protein